MPEEFLDPEFIKKLLRLGVVCPELRLSLRKILKRLEAEKENQ